MLYYCRTITAKFTIGEPLFYVKFTDEQFDERSGVNVGSLYYYGKNNGISTVDRTPNHVIYIIQ